MCSECGAECGLAHARRVWETARPKPTSPWSCVAPLSPPYSGTGFIYPPSFSHALDSGSDPRRRPAPAVRTDGGSGVVGRSQQHRRVLVRWSDLRADDVRPCVSRPSDIVQSPSTSFRSHLHLRFRFRFRFRFRLPFWTQLARVVCRLVQKRTDGVRRKGSRRASCCGRPVVLLSLRFCATTSAFQRQLLLYSMQMWRNKRALSESDCEDIYNDEHSKE